MHGFVAAFAGQAGVILENIKTITNRGWCKCKVMNLPRIVDCARNASKCSTHRAKDFWDWERRKGYYVTNTGVAKWCAGVGGAQGAESMSSAWQCD